MIVLLVLLAGTAAAQDEIRFDTWQEAQAYVSEVLDGREVSGRALVSQANSYRVNARPVHAQDASIDWPVRMSQQEWRDRLDSTEYRILREMGTERAFSGEYDGFYEPGIYYSAATGQPLFHSEHKYDSRTGWPSFTQPISPDAVAYVWDTSLFSRRIEVVDSLSGSHLGHVFADGPGPTGQRYCMNSVAMVFVPEGGTPPPMLVPAE